MTALLIPILVFGAVFLVLMAGYTAQKGGRAMLAEMRRRLGAPEKDTTALMRSQEQSGSKLALWLAESGVGWAPSRFRNGILMGGAGGLLLGGFLGGLGQALLLAILGAAVLPAWVSVARGRRLARMDQQMPQALQLMILALRAGHALPGALALAAREAPLPIRDELRVAIDQHGLGRPIGQVIGQLAERMPGCDTAQTFAVAVLVLEQTGGNLITVIERIIETARARSQYKSKLRALTAQGRSSARILAAIPPIFAVLAALLDPSYAKTLFHSGAAGLVVVILATTLWLCGVAWTMRLVKKNS